MPIESRSRTLAWLLMALSMVLYMLLSAQALLVLGIPYDAPYGPPFAKFHPATYLLFLAWMVALSSQGNPIRVLLAQFQQHRLLATFFICVVTVFAWVVFRHGTPGAAFIVEALWTPAVAAFTLYLLNARQQRRVFQVIMGLLFINSVVALIEAITPVRLIPLHVDSSDVVEDVFFRSSAFLGHPLHNAMITAALMSSVALLPWSKMLRLAMVAAMALSLLAFGGRASLVLSVVFYGVYGVSVIFGNIVRGRYNYVQLTGGSLAGVLAATLAGGLAAATGLGARIFSNLRVDSSASVRLRVWDIFHYISNADIWIGIPPQAIDHASMQIGLDLKYEAIENFWIYLLLQFGVIGFIPFCVGFICLLRMLWQSATTLQRVSLLLFLVVASTANTLASKSISLMLLTTVIVSGAAFRNGQCLPHPSEPLKP